MYLVKFLLMSSVLIFAVNGSASAEPPQLITSTAPAASIPVIVGTSDVNLRYIGRWDCSQSGIALGYWNAHYVRTRFTGASVSVRLATATGLAVSIDGEPFRSVSAGVGDTLLNLKPLRPGQHTLQLGSDGQNSEVSFEGLALQPDAKTLPPAERPIIEFIGDSITTGTNSNYAWCAAEMLGRDHVQIAFSGVALTDGFGCTSKIGMETQFFRLKNYNHLKEDSQPNWDFTVYTPEIVVILLGQNDQCGRAPADAVRAAYVQFVSRIRAKYSRSPIIMMRTLGGPYETAIQQAFDQLKKTDTNVHYVDTTDWLDADDFVDGIHPSASGNLKVARLLANELAPLLTTPITKASPKE